MNTFSGKFAKPLPLLHYKGSLKDIIKHNTKMQQKSSIEPSFSPLTSSYNKSMSNLQKPLGIMMSAEQNRIPSI